MGLDTQEFERAYGDEKIENSLFYAKDLNDRHTVLWLYHDLIR